MTSSADYVFADAEQEQEAHRLRAMQDAFDADTFRRLERLGVGPGASCLEVGIGAGSVLHWLADRCGPRGRVVGLDIDPRLVGDVTAPHVTIHRGDVTVADLGENVFDLVHARFVFIHIREREKALVNVLRSLKPGGQLILEEPDFGPAGPSWEEGSETGVIARIYEATRQMYLATGGDPFLGRRLAGWLQTRGLDIDGSEASAALWRGGSPRGRLRKQAVEHLRPRLLATSSVTEDDLQKFLGLAEDPGVWAFDYTTVAVWGRRRPDWKA